MAESKTRAEEIEENIEAIEEKYGSDALDKIAIQLLRDINESLAILVDK